MAGTAVAQQTPTTALTKFTPETALPDTFQARFDGSFGEVSYGDTNIRFIPMLYRCQVVELNSKDIPDTRDHLGEFYFREYGLDDNDHFAKELNVVPVGVLGEKRYLYLGAYNPNAEKKEADCFSDDGKTPSLRAKNHFADTCATCEHSVWVDGQKPKCINIKQVLFFDLERKIFILYSFKGTGLSAWNKIYRQIEGILGTSYVQGKVVTDLYLNMKTIDKNLYHQLDITRGKEKEVYQPQKYVYFIQYFIKEVLPSVVKDIKEMDEATASAQPAIEVAAGEVAAWDDQSKSDKALADLPF